MHHAAYLLVRGRLQDAWAANPLIYVVGPLLVFLYVRHVLKLWRTVFVKRRLSGR